MPFHTILIDRSRLELTLGRRVGSYSVQIESWVTAEHVAEHLGVAKDTVYRWRERKGLPAHKVGRLWKFQLSEIDEWVRIGGADEGVSGDEGEA
jgi:excisionase family DNA binding protein